MQRPHNRMGIFPFDVTRQGRPAAAFLSTKCPPEIWQLLLLSAPDVRRFHHSLPGCFSFQSFLVGLDQQRPAGAHQPDLTP